MKWCLSLVAMFVVAFAVGFAVAQSPTPSRVQGIAGPVTVVVSDSLLATTGHAGEWDAVTRTITVQRGAKCYEAQVLGHELFHAGVWDTGAELEADEEERLADIMGAALATMTCSK